MPSVTKAESAAVRKRPAWMKRPEMVSRPVPPRLGWSRSPPEFGEQAADGVALLRRLSRHRGSFPGGPSGRRASMRNEGTLRTLGQGAVNER